MFISEQWAEIVTTASSGFVGKLTILDLKFVIFYEIIFSLFYLEISLIKL